MSDIVSGHAVALVQPVSAPLIELFMWMNCDPDGEGPGGSTNVFPHKKQLTEAFFLPPMF